MNSFKRIGTFTACYAITAMILTIICLLPVSVSAFTCPSARWVKAGKIGAFPEDSTQYYVFQFTNDPNKPVMLKLNAQFPYARYFSYTLYAVDNGDNKGDPIKYNGKVQYLVDADIVTDMFNRNPYLETVPRDVKNRNYTVYIVNEGSYRIRPNGGIDPNTLVVPNNVSKVSVFLRVYVPDDARDPKGGVALPIIQAYKEQNAYIKTQAECPAPSANSVSIFDVVDFTRFDRPSILFDDPHRDRIETFKPGDYGLFPNGDCPYLTTPLMAPLFNSGKVAVLRFKAPRFPNTRAGDDFTKDDEVRYWSVCIGDWTLTTSTGCIADQDAKIDEDGFVNVEIGTYNQVIDDPRWNFLPWSTNADPILIFRQITPKANFKQSFRVPQTAFDKTTGTIFLNQIYNAAITPDPNDPPEVTQEKKDKVASFAIEDYAPVGKYCTAEEFQKDRCGFYPGPGDASASDDASDSTSDDASASDGASDSTSDDASASDGASDSTSDGASVSDDASDSASDGASDSAFGGCGFIYPFDASDSASASN